MNLRPYQNDAVNAIEAGWNDFRKQLAVLPTGGGKTIIFSHLAMRRWQRCHGRTLILAHRDELIRQAADKLHKATGIIAEVEKADEHASLDAPVVVASVQSLHKDRIGKFSPDHFSLVVADEAHHALSNQWRGVLDYFSEADTLGVTATPDRGDKRNLGEFFENIAIDVSLLSLIKDGYLCDIKVQSVPIKIDLSTVKTTAGDFDDRGLGDAIVPWLETICGEIARIAPFRRTLVFTPLIDTSRKFVTIARRMGLNAEHVDGNSPDRDDIKDRFASGQIDIVSNAMLWTEGFDDPGIDCIVILRPTKSRALFSQMVGRGTRVAPFKSDLLLLDFLWLHEKHKIVKPASLIAKDEIEAETMSELIELSPGGQMDLIEVAGTATAQREAALKRKLAENKGRKGMTLSAEDWCLANGRYDIADYEPVMKWESGPPTEKQLAMLKRAKVDPASVTSKGMAAKIISAFLAQKKLVLASPKERAFAMKFLGAEPPDNFTRAEFRKLMAQR